MSVDVRVKFGDSRSNGSLDIREVDFVVNKRSNEHDDGLSQLARNAVQTPNIKISQRHAV